MVKKDGGAVQAATDWTVNGSAAQGRAMLRDFSRLMLRAYNAEADNLVRGMKPYKLDPAVDRLNKVAATIERLGKRMNIRIAAAYHRHRVKELELTADYQAKLAEEKDREREEKARLREERRVQQEIECERARLEKERAHYANALAALESKGDGEGAAKLREQLAELDHAIEDVDYRAANLNATPPEVKQHLLELAGNLLEYEETPEALEYHQRGTEARRVEPPLGGLGGDLA